MASPATLDSLVQGTDTKALVAEFKGVVGLTGVDAARAAFCALAFARGWSTARIGRFLGITRARVGQRIDRLWLYTQKYEGSMPLLTQLMQSAPQRNDAESGVRELPVAMEASSWEDAWFAKQMLALVVQ